MYSYEEYFLVVVYNYIYSLTLETQNKFQMLNQM